MYLAMLVGFDKALSVHVLPKACYLRAKYKTVHIMLFLICIATMVDWHIVMHGQNGQVRTNLLKECPLQLHSRQMLVPIGTKGTLPS